MPQNFIECRREQDFLMPPDVREWLPEGHLACFVLDVVEAFDLAAVLRLLSGGRSWSRCCSMPMRAGCARRGRSSAPARRMSLSGAGGQPEAGSRHAGAVRGAPCGGARRSLQRGLEAVRRGRAGEGWGDRDRWQDPESIKAPPGSAKDPFLEFGNRARAYGISCGGQVR